MQARQIYVKRPPVFAEIGEPAGAAGVHVLAMKTPHLLVLAGLLGALASGQPLLAGTEVATAPAESGPGPESQLQPDMPAQRVLEIMGKPDTVSVLRTDSGKAEVWTYRRESGSLAERTTFDTSGTPSVGDAFYRDDSRAEALPADLHGAPHATTQVIQLLMFNDRYAAQKVTREVTDKTGP
jgi:hypothetical protein